MEMNCQNDFINFFLFYFKLKLKNEIEIDFVHFSFGYLLCQRDWERRVSVMYVRL